MKYKIYFVLLTITAFTYTFINADIQDDSQLDVTVTNACQFNNIQEHDYPSITYLKITQNGVSVFAEVEFTNDCSISYTKKDNCDKCNSEENKNLSPGVKIKFIFSTRDVAETSYSRPYEVSESPGGQYYFEIEENNTVLLTVYQDGSPVSTHDGRFANLYYGYLSTGDGLKDSYGFSKFDFPDLTLPEYGSYSFEVTVTEQEGKSSSISTDYNYQEQGFEGTFELTDFIVKCSAEGLSTTFGPESFNGENTFTVEGGTFNLKFNFAGVADDWASFPCIEQYYSFDESGDVNVTDDKFKVSYTQDGESVYQEFDYTFDGTNLSFTIEEDDGSRLTFNYVLSDGGFASN